MVICLYHGSSIASINELQTGAITNYLSANLAERVIEAYYSKIVCNKLGTANKYYLDVLTENYDDVDEIKILVTNLIPGEEYQKICRRIKKLDVAGKVTITSPLITCDAIESFLPLIATSSPTLYIAHGSNQEIAEYQLLKESLVARGDNLLLMSEDLNNFVQENNLPTDFVIKPLMFTRGHHFNQQIKQEIYPWFIDNGFNPLIDNQALYENELIGKYLLTKLK